MPLVAALCAALLGAGAGAQSATPLKLPLDNLGLEHLDIVVPDTAAAAQFYARIFRTAAASAAGARYAPVLRRAR